MKVFFHPAQTAAKPRLSDGAGLLDGFQSSLFAMDAKLLEERTVFKMGTSTGVERVVGDGAKWRITNFNEVVRAMAKWT